MQSPEYSSSHPPLLKEASGEPLLCLSVLGYCRKQDSGLLPAIDTKGSFCCDTDTVAGNYTLEV